MHQRHIAKLTMRANRFNVSALELYSTVKESSGRCTVQKVAAARGESAGSDKLDGVPIASSAVYAAVAVACLGAFQFGYHLGVVNGPLQQIAADLSFSQNVFLQGLVVSISLAGAAVGSLGGSGLADSLGRRKSFILDSIPLFVGSALSALASDVNGMLLGRGLVGIGIGFASALVPLYISEVAPTSQRGQLGSVNQLVICIGILGALVANVVVPVEAWRSMFAFAALPAALVAVGMLFSPETPAFLLSKGKRADAETAALSLWGKGYATELYGDAAGQVPDGEAATSTEPEDVSWGKMMTGANGKLVAICCTIFLLQQFSGINAIVYFSSAVFRDAGIQSDALASAAVGLINVLGTMIAASLMDKRGRKQLLTVSMAGQGLAMLAMAAGFALPALTPLSGVIALAGTLTYVLMFALGTGPVPALLCSELLPISIRGRGVSMAMGVHWICNFMLGQLFLQAVSAVGVSGVYCFFSVVCLIGVVFVQQVVVETKGKSADELKQLLG